MFSTVEARLHELNQVLTYLTVICRDQPTMRVHGGAQFRLSEQPLGLPNRSTVVLLSNVL